MARQPRKDVRGELDRFRESKPGAWIPARGKFISGFEIEPGILTREQTKRLRDGMRPLLGRVTPAGRRRRDAALTALDRAISELGFWSEESPDSSVRGALLDELIPRLDEVGDEVRGLVEQPQPRRVSHA